MKLSKDILLCNICFNDYNRFSVTKKSDLDFYRKRFGRRVVKLCSNLISHYRKKHGMGKNC